MLSANNLFYLSILCVSAARWYGQCSAFYYSLEKIATADELDSGFGTWL